MSKAPRWIGQETALFWRYVGEVKEEWGTLLGSVVVIGVLWLAELCGMPVLAQVQEVAPWATRNRLLVVAAVLILAAAQYRIWRRLRISADSEDPDIDKRLEWVNEAYGRTAQYEREIREYARLRRMSLPPRAGHTYTVWLKVLASSINQSILIECTAPIYKAFGFYHYSGKSRSAREPVHKGQKKVLITFGDAPLPKGATVRIKVHSPEPVALRRVEVLASSPEPRTASAGLDTL
jgi:hypothetical protein